MRHRPGLGGWPTTRQGGASELGEPPTLTPTPAPLHTHEEAADLVGPPLDAYHEHAGEGQGEEGAPVLQALHGPA